MPFSTTDTEPEMRECNLGEAGRRQAKGNSKKAAVYSTSETEEEYQAYLRSKPKWHGKGGHKDSWDPLLIQSPPQITQKPVGIIQKPKATQPAIERGMGFDPQLMDYQPISSTGMEEFVREEARRKEHQRQLEKAEAIRQEEVQKQMELKRLCLVYVIL